MQLVVENVVVTNPSKICNVFNNYFLDIVENDVTINNARPFTLTWLPNSGRCIDKLPIIL